ncbi:MAG: hypothetical protein IT580_21310, partial [Verrucomicrobiales bacterium]|nr:hypothetical protein [Verrucomicrobiales bacterium]
METPPVTHRLPGARVVLLLAAVTLAGWLAWGPDRVVAADAGAWNRWAVSSTNTMVLPTAPVWFRAWIRVPDAMAGMSGPDLWRDSMTMTLRGLPGPVVVMINGRRILETRDISATEPRRFKVPRGSFEKGLFNTVVLGVDGAVARSGLVHPPLIAGYFDEVRLDRPWSITSQTPTEAELAAV